MRTSTTLNCPLHLCQAGDCQHLADCCLDREAYILPLYGVMPKYMVNGTRCKVL